MIMPRSGRIAWNCLLQPCLAEPPALSPSTMRISPPSAIASAVIRCGALGGYSVRDDLPSDVVRGGPMVAGRDRLDLASAAGQRRDPMSHFWLIEALHDCAWRAGGTGVGSRRTRG
jgi:hypothetical protein